MPDFLKNSTAPVTARVLYQGAPRSDAAVTVSVWDPSGTEIVTNQTASYVLGSEGLYRHTMSATLTNKVGAYRARWNVTVAGSALEFETIFTVGYAPFGAITVADVRRFVMRLGLDDQEEAPVASASLTTIVCPSLSAYPDDHFKGWSVYVAGGAGQGVERRISGFTSSTGTLTVPAMPSPPDGTSVIELSRFFSASRVNEAVRQAQLEASPRVLLPVTNESIVVGSTTQTEYDVPVGLVMIHDITVLDATGAVSSHLAPKDWKLIPGSRKLVVPVQATGSVLRIQGSARPGDALFDSSYVEAPFSYLVNKASAILLRAKAGGPSVDPDATLQRSMVFENLAMGALGRAGQRVPANSRAVE